MKGSTKLSSVLTLLFLGLDFGLESSFSPVSSMEQDLRRLRLRLKFSGLFSSASWSLPLWFRDRINSLLLLLLLLLPSVVELLSPPALQQPMVWFVCSGESFPAGGDSEGGKRGEVTT